MYYYIFERYLFLIYFPKIININLILFTYILSKKHEYHFLETHIIRYELKIIKRKSESGKVKSVVCKFYINYGKEENVDDNTPRKKTNILLYLQLIFN